MIASLLFKSAINYAVQERYVSRKVPIIFFYVRKECAIIVIIVCRKQVTNSSKSAFTAAHHNLIHVVYIG